MSNTLATLAGSLVARRILETLLAEFPALTLFSTDFSPEQALFNQPIKIQTPSTLTAGDYSTANGYVAQDVTQTEVPLTINKHKHVTYGFNDQERSSTATGLIERFAKNGAYALGSAMMADLFALVTAANFTNSTLVTAANYNRAAVVALSKKLNGRNIPSIGRFSIVNDGYYETLANDTTVIANAGSPSDTVRSGQIKNVHGILHQLYSQLPANGESLAGIAGTADALAIATRVPTMPANPGEIPGVIQTVTEEKTGLSLQLRTWYDIKLGQELRTFTIMYGVAVGNATCLERLRLA